MPELDGYEVARRIRSTPRDSELLLVALTGVPHRNDVSVEAAALAIARSN